MDNHPRVAAFAGNRFGEPVCLRLGAATRKKHERLEVAVAFDEPPPRRRSHAKVNVSHDRPIGRRR